jgi:hypothetical protein
MIDEFFEHLIRALEGAGVDLDRAYVERWVRELGLDAQWQKARSLAG